MNKVKKIKPYFCPKCKQNVVPVERMWCFTCPICCVVLRNRTLKE